MVKLMDEEYAIWVPRKLTQVRAMSFNLTVTHKPSGGKDCIEEAASATSSINDSFGAKDG